MSEPFVGEIRMCGFNFAPRGWAFCNGQLLQISQNSAMFSLLGTQFGGDGRTTFGLPDLRGRVPMHWGQGPGLTNRVIGQKFGTETETLSLAQIPAHNHAVGLRAKAAAGSTTDPGGNVLASTDEDTYINAVTDVDMNTSAVSEQNIGGGAAHNNIQPVQCVTFIIALVGLFPSRN